MNRPDRIEQYDKIESLLDEASEMMYLMKKYNHKDTEFNLRRVELSVKEALANLEFLAAEVHAKAVLK